jgi:DNA-binding LacI/PurR family transcriptional regulator
LIFLGHRLPVEAAALVRAAAPACAPVVNGCEFSPKLGIPGVHIDNAKAAAEAMTHLYSLGHRRIGVVTGPLVSPLSRDRLRGATSQARRAGAERGLLVVQGDSRSSRVSPPDSGTSRERARPPRSSASTTRWPSAYSTPRASAASQCPATCR